MNLPNLNKDYSVFGPWLFSCEKWPTFKIDNYSINYKNGQRTFQKGTGQIQVTKVTYTPGTNRPAYALDNHKNIWAFLFPLNPDHDIQHLPIYNLM